MNARHNQSMLKETKEKTKLTLDDVALRAGVSVATVSRVINNSTSVSQDLADRVRQAMQDLGFEAGPKSRSKPYIIALLTTGSGDPTSAAIIGGAQDEVNRLGLCLVVINITEDPGYQTQNLALLKHLSFDGLVIDHARLDPECVVREYRLDNLPIAVVTPFIDSPRFYCVSADRENGMYQATKYLLSLNHKDIAYISGLPELEISQSRLQGIKRALAEAGLQLRTEYYRQGVAGIDAGFEAAISILSSSGERRPTAIIAYNDLLAIGAMHAIRTFNLSVPKDISVVGFNEVYFTPHTNPPLTTVSQPAYREGQLAIQKIYNNLQGNDTDKGGYSLLECRLVVRESTGPCPASREAAS
jgi:DNA-binding LacI/PurR family transcriptional regulator